MATKLIKLPPPPGLKKAVILDKKAAVVQGATITSGGWRTRDLNTVEGDTSIVNLSNNQFTLPGGSYLIYSTAGCRDGYANRTRLYNVTDSSVLVEGSTGNTINSAAGLKSHIKVKVDLPAAKTFELQHIVQTTGSAGTASGTNPIYAQITILKL